MKALINTGHYEVHCLCYQYDNQPLEEVIDGIHVHRWNRGGFGDCIVKRNLEA